MTAAYVPTTDRYVLLHVDTGALIGRLEVVSPIIASRLIKVGTNCYRVMSTTRGETELHAPRQVPVPGNGWSTSHPDTEDDYCATLHVLPYDLRTDPAEEEIHEAIRKLGPWITE
jgi:hypothetical protein